jgi:hypothetical protein
MANPKNDSLIDIANMLNSLNEVESYIITDMDGRIHMASYENYDENMINSSIYLWVIGSQFGAEINVGEPGNLIYYLKTRKRLIQKYGDYLLILNLIDVTAFPVFKRKLYDLFHRSI